MADRSTGRSTPGGRPQSAGPTNAWYHREAFDDATRTWRVSCYLSDRFPDGEVAAVHGPDDLDGAFRLWHAATDVDGRPQLQISEQVAPEAPAVWFVGVPHRDHDPPSFDLVAFRTHHVPMGTVIDNPAFMALPVRTDEQVGAIRWFPSTAVVDQVFVVEGLRRSGLATTLVYAASAYHQMQGWPGRLHSDGRRTELGQRFVAGLRHPDRIAPWTGYSRPMDPD
jgi:hypothetical protein